MVCLIAATCLTFTCDDYVVPQWKLLENWYNKHLRSVLGPLAGRSSDGDPRRRKAFSMSSTIKSMPNINDLFTIDTPMFTFGTIMRTMGPVMNMDQDYIHNGKKLVNVLGSATRTILLGEWQLNLGVLKVIRDNFTMAEHGLQKADLERKGYTAMDWPSAFRLAPSPPVRQ